MARSSWIMVAVIASPVLASYDRRFFFLPYQVADGAAGPQTAHVPLSQVQSLLAPGLKG